MYQFPFSTLPSLRVQPRYLLPAGMEITSYNHHRRLLSSQRLCPQYKTTGFESSLLSYPINSNVVPFDVRAGFHIHILLGILRTELRIAPPTVDTEHIPS